MIPDPRTILGLPPGPVDRRALKVAYARLLRQHRPDEDPEGFRRVHDAYRRLTELVEAGAWDDDDDETDHHDDGGTVVDVTATPDPQPIFSTSSPALPPSPPLPPPPTCAELLADLASSVAPETTIARLLELDDAPDVETRTQLDRFARSATPTVAAALDQALLTAEGTVAELLLAGRITTWNAAGGGPLKAYAERWLHLADGGDGGDARGGLRLSTAVAWWDHRLAERILTLCEDNQPWLKGHPLADEAQRMLLVGSELAAMKLRLRSRLDQLHRHAGARSAPTSDALKAVRELSTDSAGRRHLLAEHPRIAMDLGVAWDVYHGTADGFARAQDTSKSTHPGTVDVFMFALWACGVSSLFIMGNLWFLTGVSALFLLRRSLRELDALLCTQFHRRWVLTLLFATFLLGPELTTHFHFTPWSKEALWLCAACGLSVGAVVAVIGALARYPETGALVFIQRPFAWLTYRAAAADTSALRFLRLLVGFPLYLLLYTLLTFPLAHEGGAIRLLLSFHFALVLLAAAETAGLFANTFRRWVLAPTLGLLCGTAFVGIAMTAFPDRVQPVTRPAPIQVIPAKRVTTVAPNKDQEDAKRRFSIDLDERHANLAPQHYAAMLGARQHADLLALRFRDSDLIAPGLFATVLAQETNLDQHDLTAFLMLMCADPALPMNLRKVTAHQLGRRGDVACLPVLLAQYRSSSGQFRGILASALNALLPLVDAATADGIRAALAEPEPPATP